MQKETEANEARWNQLDRAKEARNLASEMFARDIQSYMHEWHAGEVVGDEDVQEEIVVGGVDEVVH